MPAVTSRRNPIVARFRAIREGEHDGLVLLDGAHLIEEALAAGVRVHEAAVLRGAGDRPHVDRLEEQLRLAGVPVVSASAPVMQALSPVRSASPIVAAAERPTAAETRIYAGVPLVVVAVDVQDPGNVGAMVRVTEAAGGSGVVCAGACADPFGWKALRGSMGSALRLPIRLCRDGDTAIAEARRHGCRVVAAVPRGGRPLFESDLRGPLAVLIGAEGTGLSRSQVDAADAHLVIPMEAPVESLNVAISAGLVAYEARRQRSTNPEP